MAIDFFECNSLIVFGQGAKTLSQHTYILSCSVLRSLGWKFMTYDSLVFRMSMISIMTSLTDVYTPSFLL